MLVIWNLSTRGRVRQTEAGGIKGSGGTKIPRGDCKTTEVLITPVRGNRNLLV
jgi:hypothetical protein